ncbi:MAG: HAMP domain-containing histidine kinase [Flammeovirgaceae bacterium]|jgi:two-component system phosphate regulon sensor histidine kinase PhoR|nr:HAMP domain-containing histidine kinase [Flammeovirgaceae bacterium]
MNKKRKLIVLIAVSLVLLLGLQGYWLEKAYEKAYSDLKRISNIEFRNVIFQLRDSILVHTFTGYSDSSFQRSQPADISGITFQSAQIDSVNVNTKKSKVQILISSDNKNKDSIYKAFKPLSKNIRSKFNSADNFVIKITPDSLPADSIKHYFTKSMMKLGLVTQIEITSKTPEFESFRFGVPTFPEMLNPLKENDVWFPQSIETEFVRLNPFRTYKATLPEIGNILFKQIAAQIFLSVTLTILIAFVLIILYKNLVAQQRLVEQKDDLISNITHELKTPIATVSVALEAIQNFDKHNTEKQTEYLTMARAELNRLTSLTEKILLASFSENENQTFIKKPLHLQEVIQTCWRNYTLLFAKEQAEVSIHLPEIPVYVLGNQEFLSQALSNLIDNALKYKKDKTNIRLTLRVENKMAVISIQDKGIGIPPEYLNKIFDKFFRVPSGDVHNHKGYGLGLSFVKNVIEKHKGKIEAKSNRHEGSEFTITIPAIV